LFEVPEQYFEQLQFDVMQHVAKEEKRKKATKKWISAMSAAASIALIVVFSYFLFVNRNLDDHFYVYQEVTVQEDTILTLDSNHLAEASEIMVTEVIEVKEKSEILSSPAVPVVETIVYRAVDFYISDYELDNFYDMMYELEFFYDY
jgi:Ca2+/H+ antiporter